MRYGGTRGLERSKRSSCIVMRMRFTVFLFACLVAALAVACDDDPAAETDLTIPEMVEQVRGSIVTVSHARGEGSGVVWDGNGHIVTNHHVVAGASDVEIVLATGERLPAEIVATDPLTDLAVLEVERDELSAATFNEELPRVGEAVIAIGNPLGFEGSVTYGIVSGVHRSIPSGGTTPALVDLLQTDAAISPGNSGGALLDASGEVIGINVAYIPPEQSAVALGFAIPAATAVDVVEQLLDSGRVEHAFLGIEPRSVTPAIADQLGVSVDEGVFVFTLVEGGPADSAGLRPGDVIVQLEGTDIATVEDLFAALREHSPGETVQVTVVRGGNEEAFDVQLQERVS